MPMPGKMGGFGYDDAQVRRAPADGVNFRIPAPPRPVPNYSVPPIPRPMELTHELTVFPS